MPYEIFARKYRPWTFEEVIGQLSVVRTIQNAIATGRVAQAYLFSGSRGTGKTTVARILAKALNCAKGPTPQPCPDRSDPCLFCRAIHEGSAVDVLEIDGASNRQVDDIEPLREMVKYKPVAMRTKVLIIDEVHMLSTHAFNALLKTLEEPPPNTVFVFATTEFHKVPATIVSRCQHFEFRRISDKDIINHLMEIAKKEGLTITPTGLSMIADSADGSLRDAQSVLDQAVAFSGKDIPDDDLRTILGAIGNEVLFAFSAAVLEERPGDIFKLVESVTASGYDLRHLFGKLIEHFRALLLVRTVDRPEDLLMLGSEELESLRRQAEKASPEDLLRYLLALQQAESGLKYSALPRIYLEAFLVKLCHFRKIVPIQELLKSLEEMRPLPEPPGSPRSSTPSSSRPGERSEPPVGPKGPSSQAAPSFKSPVGPGSGLGAGGGDAFARVLERLKSDRPPLAALLAQASSSRASEGEMEVLFEAGRGFFARSLQDKDRRLIDRIASEVLGREVRVRFVEEPPAGGNAPKPAREIETALADPAVRYFMDTFKAQVLSVDPIKSARSDKPGGAG